MFCKCKKRLHARVQGENYVISEGVIVISTPGHSGPDISLIVHNTINGTVLLAGIIYNIACTCFMSFVNLLKSTK